MEKKTKILFDKYKVGKLLGQGNFAKVYYAKKVGDGQEVAIKVINKEKVSKVGLDVQIKREIFVMKLLRHPNIIQVQEVMASKGNIYIILEYVKGGELFHKVSKGRLKEDVARWLFQQLISAVHFCHERGIYHRDLKLENLLLDEFGHLKVSDFGLSALVDSSRDEKVMLRTICGTPAYVAPEVIKRRPYDGAKADIWSCGVILFAMLAGHLPFRDSDVNRMYEKIKRAEYRCPNWFPPEVRKLLTKILDPNCRTRISAAKIMDNPWFRKGLGPRLVTSNEAAASSGAATLLTGEMLASNGSLVHHDDLEEASHLVKKQQEMVVGRLKNMNAFDIISLSSGFDLSGLFVGDDQREDVQFTSREAASTIISKLTEIAERFQLKVVKKDGGFFRLSSERRAVELDVEIFEIAECFHSVEMKKSGGDSLEYRKILRRDIKPAIEDIVWAWQGDKIISKQVVGV